tara:strand:+ start:254 stop:565 length:312 start_codon:yes stop_codon:yes gene_type:complete
MIVCEYYQNYKGPELVSATLDNIDITKEMKEIYGENLNWKGCLWKYKEAFGENCINKKFRFDFVSEDKREHWFYGFIKDKEQYFNPPLATPLNQMILFSSVIS